MCTVMRLQRKELSNGFRDHLQWVWLAHIYSLTCVGAWVSPLEIKLWFFTTFCLCKWKHTFFPLSRPTKPHIGMYNKWGASTCKKQLHPILSQADSCTLLYLFRCLYKHLEKEFQSNSALDARFHGWVSIQQVTAQPKSVKGAKGVSPF
jgi:hypothetical protein